MRYARKERYALVEEEVSILKALWTTRGPLNFQVRDATERQKQEMKTLYNKSAANQHVHELAREHGDLPLPQLWTGITRVRPGAGIAVVGNPAQCADTLQQFIDAGCHSFCLSGYLHDVEAERFGRLVRPILAENNRGRLAA